MQDGNTIFYRINALAHGAVPRRAECLGANRSLCSQAPASFNVRYRTVSFALFWYNSSCKGKLINMEEKIIVTEEKSQTGSNAVWAIALIVIVAIIAGVLYYSGILRTSPKKQQVDINVTAPAAPAAPAPAR